MFQELETLIPEVRMHEEGISLLSFTNMHHYGNLHRDIIHALLEKIPICKEEFLKLLNTKFNNELKGYTIKEMKQEEWLPNAGRVDLVFFLERKAAPGKVIIIENKIWANDQQNQLKRYYDYYSDCFGTDNTYLCYLTLEGRLPSEYSIIRNELQAIGNHYSALSYKEDILSWLENVKKCLADTTNQKTTLSAVIQYELTVREILEMNNQAEELKKIWYGKLEPYGFDKLQVANQVIHNINVTHTKLEFFHLLYLKMNASLSEEQSSRLVYVCNQKIIGTDYDSLKTKAINETAPCLGLVFNAVPPVNGCQCYGIGLEWQGTKGNDKSYF